MERSLAILGVLGCLALAASGCGSSSSSSSTSTTGAGTTGATGSGPTATSTTPTPSAGGSSSGSAGSGTGSGGSSGPATNANGAPLGSNTSKTGDNSIQTYGSEAGGADKAAVAAAMRSFFRAIATTDYAKICADITSQNRTALEQFSKLKHAQGQGCAGLLPKLLVTSPGTTATARRAANGTVTHVRIGGGTAFVLFRPAGGGSINYFVMKQENGAWKSTSLATGTPINPPVPSVK